MKAVVLSSYTSRLAVDEVPEPTVGPRDVLIDVHAAGLNQLDEKLRAGEFKQIVPLELPAILGLDVAGTVVAVGSEVQAFAPGDRVYGRVQDGRIGTFAQRIAADEDDLAPIPPALPMNEAASLPLVALTAWQALVVRARVRPGQNVLIHAGAGGVGSIAIQLAKHLGATVATTASAANAEFVRSLGADVVIDYRADDFEQQLNGYDVVLDSVGGDNLMKSLRILRPGGVAIGIAGPPDPAFARRLGLNPVLRAGIAALSRTVRRAARRLGVEYSFLWMSASGEQLREISALVESGAIRPIIDRVIPFEEIPEAVARLRTGGGRGKTVALIARGDAQA